MRFWSVASDDGWLTNADTGTGALGTESTIGYSIIGGHPVFSNSGFLSLTKLTQILNFVTLITFSVCSSSTSEHTNTGTSQNYQVGIVLPCTRHQVLHVQLRPLVLPESTEQEDLISLRWQYNFNTIFMMNILFLRGNVTVLSYHHRDSRLSKSRNFFRFSYRIPRLDISKGNGYIVETSNMSERKSFTHRSKRRGVRRRASCHGTRASTRSDFVRLTRRRAGGLSPQVQQARGVEGFLCEELGIILSHSFGSYVVHIVG